MMARRTRGRFRSMRWRAPIATRLAQRIGRGRLGYGDPRGSAELRAAISNMLNIDRGLTTTPDNICLTRGSQMAIYLAARILAGPGDTVVMEELSYPPAREAFRFAGAEVVPVPLDAQGMRVDELEKICRKKRVRAVYVTPHHQFPTTVLMKPDRRMRLLALAAQFGFAIVEDDYDHEFHFAHQPMLPLASADMSGKVVYIGSLSKILSPSLRLGYLVGPKSFIDRAASEIMMIDRQGDPATEGAVDRADRFRRTAPPYPQGDEALWRAAGFFRRPAEKPVRRPHRIHRARWRPGLLGAFQGHRSGPAGGGGGAPWRHHPAGQRLHHHAAAGACRAAGLRQHGSVGTEKSHPAAARGAGRLSGVLPRN